MVFSNIAKALDPVWRETRKNPVDPFWTRLFERIERLVKLQLLVCPSSPIHEKESIVTPYSAVLKRMREHWGAGTSFKHELRVHSAQLQSALACAFAIEPLTYFAGGPKQAIHGEVNEWNELLHVTVSMPTDVNAPDRLRASRQATAAKLQELWSTWRREKTSFVDRYQAELGGLYHAWYLLYTEFLTERDRAQADAAHTAEILYNPRLEVDVILGLVRRFTESGDDWDAANRHVATFLNSDAARFAPANSIGALLVAALARKAVAGQRKVPTGGAWNDIKAIATYLPYSDAMFVDDQFAGLMREEPVRAELEQYDARVFSNQNRAGFLAWLEDIERSADPSHIATALAVYGQSGIEPYVALLQHERERERRRRRSE